MTGRRRKALSGAFTRAPSSELGDGNFATDYNANGRAIRKCRTRTPRITQDAFDFADSGVVISDVEDDYSDDMSDTITVAASTKQKGSHTPLRKKKRTRSPSPPLSLPSDDAESLSDSSSVEDLPKDPTPEPQMAGHMTVHLTINVPLSHAGPITLNIDPKNLMSECTVSGRTAPDRLTQSALARLNARSKSKKPRMSGFLDLPAELRNSIYRDIFVAEKPLNFARPTNFSRSSALLRTCKQVYEEGRSILYSENTFAIERRTQRFGSLWEEEWREMGFLNVRKFMKSVGPSNISLIRHLTFNLEDAVPCLNPLMLTNDERRFVQDDALMSVLKRLVDNSQLQTMKLHFRGRRRVDRSDFRFLDLMRRVRADSVEFVTWPAGSPYGRESKQEDNVKDTLLTACTRRRKKFE